MFKKGKIPLISVGLKALKIVLETAMVCVEHAFLHTKGLED